MKRTANEELFADFVALWFLAEEKWYLRKAFNLFDALRNVVIVLFYESKKTLEIFFAIVDIFCAIVDAFSRNRRCFWSNCGCSFALIIIFL